MVDPTADAAPPAEDLSKEPMLVTFLIGYLVAMLTRDADLLNVKVFLEPDPYGYNPPALYVDSISTEQRFHIAVTES
jgi:hypothetical protein